MVFPLVEAQLPAESLDSYSVAVVVTAVATRPEAML
jgi:hypothetical protein